jgi:TusA-related sulfurtransferase
LKRRACDAGDLELGGGLEVLLAAMLDPASPGDEVEVSTASPEVARELPAWARRAGHDTVEERTSGSRTLIVMRRGSSSRVLAPPLAAPGEPARLRPGGFNIRDWRLNGPPAAGANPNAGFVPLGSLAEAGAFGFAWQLNDRDELWSDDLAQLVEGASASQWDATRDIPWKEARGLPAYLEQAVCQVVTFIAQNEYAAYYVPARFQHAVNPEFVEVLLWLAGHVHDEARHIEVFTKRAVLNGAQAYALASAQRSLETLLQETDFTASALLLNVLGEGSFIDLLQFVARHAPDPATAAAARLAHRDELRHVRFGITHVRQALRKNPDLLSRLVAAAENRASRLIDLTGMSPLIVEALTLMAAGSLAPPRLSEAAAAVRGLMKVTAANRIARLQQAGFDAPTARYVSELHTPNLM